jgi:DNA-binding transcriptional MerR regulator/effector-binding domain-containing protein
MYTIGEFAAFGRVSVRMLRHYDAIGLLVPAEVDDHTGYRRYEASQLSALARIVGLRDLGVGLEEIREVLRDPSDVEAMRALLERRRALLHQQIAEDRARIARLDRRLSALKGDVPMSAVSTAVELKPLPALSLHEVVGSAPGFGPENMSPVIGPLYDRLIPALERAGVAVRDPSTIYYTGEGADMESESGAVAVHVGFPAEPGDAPGEFAEVTLEAVPLAATFVHHGAMSRIGESWMALNDWIEQNGYRFAGACREVYLVSEPLPQEEWVTELQWPVARAD